MILALHSLALGAVLSDGKHHTDKFHGHDIQVRPIGEVRAAPGSAYDNAKADLQAGRAAQALEGFRRAVRETPQSADALNGLAVTYDLLGRFDQSRAYYEAALVADPQSALIAYNYGYSLFLQHDYTAARPLLISAARSDDQAARAAARQTLQQIADAPADAAVHAPVAVAKQSWIERTSEGEQRLVLDRPAPVATPETGAPAEIALITPADAWTPADERRVDAAARLEALAAARAERLAARAAAAASRAADAATPAPAMGETAAASPAAMAFDATNHHRDTGGDRAPPPRPSARPPEVFADPRAVTAAVARDAAAAPRPRWLTITDRATGFHLIAAETAIDPLRRRTAPLEVGGAALMHSLAASLAAEPVSETVSRALALLTESLATMGTAADAEAPALADGLDRLAGALGLWSAFA